MAQKKNLKQKLAVAMSVVNAMNAAAAVALPYVNMTPNVVADGAKVQRLVDGLAGAMYGTAHARTNYTTDTQVESRDEYDAETSNATISVITNGHTVSTKLYGTFDAQGVQTAAGQEIVYSRGHTDNTEVHSGGRQIVSNAGKTNDTSVHSGGTQIVDNGGQTSNTSVFKGGIQSVLSGGKIITPKDKGGVLELHGEAILQNTEDGPALPYNNYTLYGGTLRLVDGATIGKVDENENVTENMVFGIEDMGTHLHTNGTLEIGSGGKAVGTVLVSGDGKPSQEVITKDGVSQLATINAGGTQIVKNGGLSQQATLNGGLQTIEKGGTSENTTVKGGTQKIEAGAKATGTMIQDGGVQTLEKGTSENDLGGVSEKITLNGGTLNVKDYAKAQIDVAKGGTLNLLDTGLAEAVFGNATTVANFTLTNLNASNDTVILGMGNDATAVVGKNLTIGTMTGNAEFVINTDIAKNKSDTITINNVTGTSQNTVRINYDPTLATNKTVPTNTLVATVKAGTATFTGVESTVGGFDFTPLITSKGNSWYITGFENAGPSEQMYASLDTATWQAIAWRDSNFVIGSRMAQLHHNPESAHQNDFWVDFTRGRNRTNNFGHAMNRTYDRVSVGYDRLVGHGWTVGLAYGYEKGTEGYEKGSGDSTGNVVTAYATWQGANGNYVDMTIKGGQLESDFTVQDDNQVTPSKADTRATGAGVSAVYGHRFENANAFYVEPHAGFYWSHLGGYDYRLSDGSDVSVDGCNSFVGNLGVNIGQRLGKGEVYARADFMHDFSGNVRVSMTKAGLNNTMENPLHDSWLNVAVGYRQNYDRVGWYAEAGCQSIGSRESSGDWVWKAGVEFKF